MDFRQALLDNLETLFNQTSEELASVRTAQVNHCGSCTSCCQADTLTCHRVGEIEYALISDRVTPEVATNFRHYIERKSRDDGSLLHPKCPNLGEGGCQIYTVRPFSCRIFGHIREEGTRLPDNCVFTGHEKVTKKSDYFREIPGSAKLRTLWREFQLLVALPTGPAAGPLSAGAIGQEENSYLNQDDPLDRTLEHVAHERYEAALGELLALEPDSETPARTELWGMTLASLGRHQEALEKYQRLLSCVPGRADLLYQAGCSAFLSGNAGLAEEYWKESCLLTPTYAPTLGMLGYLYKILEDWPAATNYFTRALEQDQTNPFFHLRLGEVLLRSGNNSEALIHLAQAQIHPSTRAQAGDYLATMATG